MNKPLYGWQRFFYPYGTSIHLQNGFLPDPAIANFSNLELVSFKDMNTYPCVIIVAEPGMGKSTSLQQWAESIENTDDMQSLFIKLNEYSEQELKSEIFRGDAFKAWAEGHSHFHVFLDGLDEALLTTRTTHALILRELKRYQPSLNRLSLRITCRTAQWPESFTNDLKSLWSDESDSLVKMYHLAPLRHRDVQEIAQANHPTTNSSFLEQIIQRNLGSLASRPVTLQLLVNIFNDGALPQKLVDIYAQGLAILCDEENPYRRTHDNPRRLSPTQRFDLAAQIAFLTIFGNYQSIWDSIDRGTIPTDALPIHQISSDAMQSSLEAIQETLATGLFIRNGQHVFWSHQTYAEFLASWYIHHKQLPIEQIVNLVFQDYDGTKKIIPQLQEPVLWLVNLNGSRSAIYDAVFGHDPLVLVNSDSSLINDEQRAKLVGLVLEYYQSEKIIDRFYVRDYEKFNHTDIAQQLGIVLHDKTKNLLTRVTTIDIASACKTVALADAMTSIACDENEPFILRRAALQFLENHKHEIDIFPIVQLLEQESGLDYGFIGTILSIVWPEHIDIKRLLRILYLYKDSQEFNSSYISFIQYNLLNEFNIAHLWITLDWICYLPRRFELSSSISDFINHILFLSWEHCIDLDLTVPLAQAIRSRYFHHEAMITGGFYAQKYTDSLDQLMSQDPDKRYLILATLLQLAENDDELSRIYHYTKLISESDLSWVIDQIRVLPEGPLRTRYVALLNHRFIFNTENDEHVERVYTASQDIPELKNHFFFQPILFDSPEALDAKASYYKRLGWDQERDNQKQEMINMQSTRIIERLNLFDAGTIDAWWHLQAQLPDELNPDITTMAIWAELGQPLQQRMITAAKTYIIEGNPRNDEWIGTEQFFRPAMAFYRAFYLLLKTESEYVRNLPIEYWRKWALALFAYPTDTLFQPEPADAFIKIAYQLDPATIQSHLRTILHTSLDQELPLIVSKINIIYDESIADILLEIVGCATINKYLFRYLIDVLMKNRHSSIFLFARSFINLPLPNDGIIFEKASIVASLLMNYDDTWGWDIVWPAIQENERFAATVIEQVSNIYDEILPKTVPLSDKQLADFYILLQQRYPKSEDLKHPEGDFYQIQPRDQIAHFRDRLLNAFQYRITATAIIELQRIIAIFPHERDLKWLLDVVKSKYAQQLWQPLKPADLLRLVHDHTLRIVQSGEQLVDVLCESLGRLQQELQGETSAAIFLWDEQENKSVKPKIEERLSDYIKRHLDRDLGQKGIIANREVELRRNDGSAPGERTDIHIDAILQQNDGSTHTITVVIEVKGCWHAKVTTAMETQLVQRYLRDGHLSYGLYIVGWYYCKKWEDPPRKWPTVNHLRNQLETQATTLSGQYDVYVKSFVLDVHI